jgi:3-oxoacyl-[acyl-carrier-protein] synthase II
MSRRVVITGAGVISSIGIGVDNFWRHCLQAKSAVAPIPEQWLKYADLRSRLWSPLHYDPESIGVNRTERLQLDPVAALAIGAAREALQQAGFTLVPAAERSRAYVLPEVDSTRVGVYFGTGIGGAHSFLQNHVQHLFQRTQEALKAYSVERAPAEDGEVLNSILALMVHPPRYHPFVVSMLMPNAASAAVGIKFSFTGPNVTFCVACASGGSEYLYDEHGHIFRGFDVAGTLVRDYDSPESANRPFDEKRSGFLFSQGGAAVLVIEELEHALRRGAKIMAEVIGYAETFDAHSMMSLAPGGEQIERMVRTALADAGLSPGDVDYINAHGTGTKNNDQTEAEVINRIFGGPVRVNSTKSLLGHTIGASGAIEALVTALSLRDGTTHVSKNIDTPLLDLNFVRSVEHFAPRIGLSQSFAFGGHNAAVVMRRFD